MSSYKYVIVDANTGVILNGKVYVHKGTAELQIKRGGFFRPDIHAPVVVELAPELMLAEVSE